MKLGDAMQDGDVRLEPLAEAHRAALKAACAEDPDIWPIYSTSYDPDHFDANFDLMLARPDWRSFALVLDGRAGRHAQLHRHRPRARGAGDRQHLLRAGDARHRLQPRVKDLMIGRAFDCGFRRIEFRVDARNARSQAAMAKMGAVREGVIRADRITWTGHVRDTVLFSILASEWRAD